MSYSLDELLTAYGRPWREFRKTVKANDKALQKARERGLTLEQADRYAIRCDLHPAEVWGIESWLAGLTESVVAA